MNDHEPIVIEEFNGLWKRGGADSCPLDHFPDCNNIQFIQSGCRSRDGIDPFLPYYNVIRHYNFVTQKDGVSTEGLLILDANGNFYHSSSPTPFVPILTIAGVEDFTFTPFAGRAYITPIVGETGMQNENIYVYLGDGTPARKAGGTAPTNSPEPSATGSGNVTPGERLWAFAYETNTGFITAPSIISEYNMPGPDPQTVTVASVTVGPSYVVARHILATKLLDSFNGDKNAYELFFVTRIDNNTDTSVDVSFFDTELINSADYLRDLFDLIPAGVNLGTYRGRLVSVGEYANISVARLSLAGQPESIDKVDGIIIVPLDGKPLTNIQEYRDTMYLYKQTRTYAFNDNGDVPSSWLPSSIDMGIGASVHGIGTVLDSGGVNVEALLVADYSGVILFNGTYIRPELSWKIRDLWLGLDRNDFKTIQILNDSLTQIMYIILTTKQMLIGDYANGMDAKNLRWAPWSFDINISTITLTNTNELVIGAKEQA